MFKPLAITTLCLALSGIAHAAPDSRVPREIYQSNRTDLIKLKDKGEGEYRALFSVRGGNVRYFARDVITHARKHGFRLLASDIQADEADMNFAYGTRTMAVSIDLNDNYTMKYEVELDLDR